jgi:hypothetical protein
MSSVSSTVGPKTVVMSHDAPSLGTDDLRDALIRSGNSYVELHARSGADGRFARHKRSVGDHLSTELAHRGVLLVASRSRRLVAQPR